MSTLDIEALLDACQRVAAIDPHLWIDASFTCSEADALADLLDAVGLADQAGYLRDAHAAEDQPGDDHYIDPDPTPPRGIARP